jgi:hypothetical protein
VLTIIRFKFCFLKILCENLPPNVILWVLPCSGKFRGSKFSRFSPISGYLRKLDPQNMYDCTVYNGHDRSHPRKLNEDWPSVKIGSHENMVLF